MEYNLNSIGGTTEKIGVNKYFLKSTFGRVYINSRIKDYELINPNKLRIGTNVINFPERTQYDNITYVHSALRSLNVGSLFEYFNITDYFLERLIKENINCSFENINFIKNISLSEIDKHSLLKPVYYRYISTKRHNPSALKIIENNLKNKNTESYSINYEKMVLYDVPCIIQNSKLRILDKLWIDISEYFDIMIDGKYTSYIFNCLSLGVNKFDRVEIILEKVDKFNLDNLFYGKQIKEIKLIKM